MAAPWRKNEEDAMMDGERPKRDFMMMDKNYKQKLAMEEHVSVPKGVYIPREDSEVFGSKRAVPGACRCSWGRTARQKHKENCRKRIEEELGATVKAEAAQRRVKEYQHIAAEG